jgi:hypothetical protein
VENYLVLAEGGMADNGTPSAATSHVRSRTESKRALLSRNSMFLEPESEDVAVEKLAREDKEQEGFAFFERGRDFQSAQSAHRFTTHELTQMKTFESFEYLPHNTQVYREHLDAVGRGNEPTISKWVCVGVIGVVAGIATWLLRNLLATISDWKLERTSEEVKKGWFDAWLVSAAISVVAIGLSSSIVVFIAPSAASGGVPDVMGYINGVSLKGIASMKLFSV